MDDKLARLTPPEFRIMDVVWSGGEKTLAGILIELNSKGRRKLSRSTVQMQVSRLEEKGWLGHRGECNRFIYQARIPRGDAVAAMVGDINRRVFGGACVDLVRTLFDVSEVTPEDIRGLRELLKEYEKEG